MRYYIVFTLIILASTAVLLAGAVDRTPTADYPPVTLIGAVAEQIPILRGNRLTEQQIYELDPWCELWQQDGGINESGAWTIGCKNGPVYHGSSRVAWDNDPRPPVKFGRHPSNWNGTLIGTDSWCYRATEAQLRSDQRRRQEQFDAQWERLPDTTCPEGRAARRWRSRTGTGWMGEGCTVIQFVNP